MPNYRQRGKSGARRAPNTVDARTLETLIGNYANLKGFEELAAKSPAKMTPAERQELPARLAMARRAVNAQVERMEARGFDGARIDAAMGAYAPHFGRAEFHRDLTSSRTRLPRRDHWGTSLPDIGGPLELQFLDHPKGGPKTSRRLTLDQQEHVESAIRRLNPPEAQLLLQRYSGLPLDAVSANSITNAVKAASKNRNVPITWDYGRADGAAQARERQRLFGRHLGDKRKERGELMKAGLAQLPHAPAQAALTFLDPVGRAAVNVLPWEAADRAEAGFNSLVNGRSFTDNLQEQRAITQADWEVNPLQSASGAIAGDGALAVLTGRVLPRLPGPLGKLGSQPMVADGVYGGLQAYASGGDWKTGALLPVAGGVVGRDVIAPLASAATKRLLGSDLAQRARNGYSSLNNRWRNLRNLPPLDAPGQVPSAVSPSDLALAKALDQAGVPNVRTQIENADAPIALIDLDEKLTALGQAAMDQSRQAGEMGKNFLKTRIGGQPGRFTDGMEKDFGADHFGPLSRDGDLGANWDPRQRSADQLKIDLEGLPDDLRAQVGTRYYGNLAKHGDNAASQGRNPFKVLADPAEKDRFRLMNPNAEGADRMLRRVEQEGKIRTATDSLLGAAEVRKATEEAFATGAPLQSIEELGGKIANPLGMLADPANVRRLANVRQFRFGPTHADALMPRLIDVNPATMLQTVDDIALRGIPRWHFEKPIDQFYQSTIAPIAVGVMGDTQTQRNLETLGQRYIMKPLEQRWAGAPREQGPTSNPKPKPR